MFTDLHPMLLKSQELTLRLVLDKQDNAKIKIFVSPNHPHGENNPALNQTVMFHGTPAELTQEFPEKLASYTPHYIAASDSVDEGIKALEATKQAAKDKVKAPGKPAGKPAEKPSAPTKTPPTGPTTISLFGDDDAGQAAGTESPVAPPAPTAGDESLPPASSAPAGYTPLSDDEEEEEE